MTDLQVVSLVMGGFAVVILWNKNRRKKKHAHKKRYGKQPVKKHPEYNNETGEQGRLFENDNDSNSDSDGD